MADLLTDSIADKKDFELLSSLQKQLISLKVNDAAIRNDAIPFLSKFSNLRRLNLSNTNITDKDLGEINSLNNLQHLNLVGTKVTANGILRLQKLKQLKSLFLYQTSVKSEDIQKIKAAFPKTEIDLGNYVVPLLTTDTTLVKPPKIK